MRSLSTPSWSSAGSLISTICRTTSELRNFRTPPSPCVLLTFRRLTTDDIAQGKRRRVFISAVGGPDELIRDVRWSTPEMEWRETLSVVELKRELELQNERWRNVIEGAEERVREREGREEREKAERSEREREERERGAREVDLGVLEAVEREGRELKGREAKEARAREWARIKEQEREDEKARVARRSEGGVAVVERVGAVLDETNGVVEVAPVSKKRKGSEELVAQVSSPRRRPRGPQLTRIVNLSTNAYLNANFLTRSASFLVATVRNGPQVAGSPSTTVRPSRPHFSWLRLTFVFLQTLS